MAEPSAALVRHRINANASVHVCAQWRPWVKPDPNAAPAPSTKGRDEKASDHSQPDPLQLQAFATCVAAAAAAGHGLDPL